MSISKPNTPKPKPDTTKPDTSTDSPEAPEQPPAAPAAPGASGARGVLAEPGQRLVARILDLLIVGLPVVLIAQAVVPRRALEPVAAVAVAVLLVLYDTVLVALWGRTPGKRFAGIEIVPAERGVDSAAERTEERAPERAREERRESGARSAAPEAPRLGVRRAFIRAVTFALPIALRPVPVLQLPAGLFWVANGALIFQGTERSALHDRCARTKVVIRR